MTIKSGVIDAIQGAIDGTKSLQQAASDVLGKLADKLLDLAVNMALFGSMSGTGTGGGLLGGFFKPKAKGGSVSGGTPYLVGERGPELFMPGRSGGIAPAGSFGGGTNVVVNVDATGSNVQGDDQSSKQLGVLLAAAVQKELIKQKRPGGILA
jgi:phage-related minor tail protein